MVFNYPEAKRDESVKDVYHSVEVSFDSGIQYLIIFSSSFLCLFRCRIRTGGWKMQIVSKLASLLTPKMLLQDPILTSVPTNLPLQKKLLNCGTFPNCTPPLGKVTNISNFVTQVKVSLLKHIYFFKLYVFRLAKSECHVYFGQCRK